MLMASNLDVSCLIISAKNLTILDFICLVYKRFDWDNAAIQKSVRMGTRTSGLSLGPGEYHKGKAISKGN